MIPDTSPHFRRRLLYLESQWRQQISTDGDLHIRDRAAITGKGHEDPKVCETEECGTVFGG